MEELASFLAVACIIATLGSYGIICLHYPKCYEYNDPIWLSLLKLWITIPVLFGSMFVWGLFFYWILVK